MLTINESCNSILIFTSSDSSTNFISLVGNYEGGGLITSGRWLIPSKS